MIRFSLSRIFDLENYWNWVGKKEPISAELYDNSGRTIFLPLENEMKRERCLVRSQHASRSCSRRVFLFSQRNVFLVNKKTQIELVGLVSTISICRLIVCFLSERSWSLCTHTWNCPYRMYRLFSFVWPFSRFYSKRLPLFVFFFCSLFKVIIMIIATTKYCSEHWWRSRKFDTRTERMRLKRKQTWNEDWRESWNVFSTRSVTKLFLSFLFWGERLNCV